MSEHERWREHVAAIRREWAAWGVSTDHLSDHELSTAINNITDALRKAGLTLADAERGLAAINLALDKRHRD